MPAANIAPSMLSSDFAQLGREAIRMVEAGANSLHMDVMDGHFVPNIVLLLTQTIGAPVIKSLRKHTDAFLDCHLMVSQPERWVDDFAQAGANRLTFHLEATDDPQKLVQAIKAKGMQVGVAIKPQTPPTAVEHLCAMVDLVLVMTVEPGFGGQEIIPECLDKVRYLRSKYPQLDIQVDGGINLQNINEAADAGANVIVSGSGIFKHYNAQVAIRAMKEAVDAKQVNFNT